ncbi:unnamed protein product [Rotaria sordida]|uniref:Uncharacterized protein n=1 Tax=Rotaria sordida TaxID=392033 RepID=A0A819XWE1_9BILA|nr:unnamed protein product [Rotaria sordida]
MTSSNQILNTYINCGYYKRYTTSLNDRSNIGQIHEQIRHLFGSYLPNFYCLKFYDIESKKFVKLNQNVLDYGSNPFQLKSSIDDQNIENIADFVELYVIDTTDENSDHDTQSGVQCYENDSISSGDSSTAMIEEETPSQPDLPIYNNTTNDNDCHKKDLSNALLSKESVDINGLLGTTSTNNNNNNNLNSDELLNAYPNENRSDSNFLLNDLISNNDPCSPDLSDALLFERQSDQNSFINNDSLEPIAIGDSMPLQNNTSYSIQSSTQLNKECICLYFSRDVKPEQKDIYKSDKFNQKEETKPNGYITRIQGIKTSAQKMLSVWPTIRTKYK